MRENEAKKSVQALMISKMKVSLRSYDQSSESLLFLAVWVGALARSIILGKGISPLSAKRFHAVYKVSFSRRKKYSRARQGIKYPYISKEGFSHMEMKP